MAAKQAEVSAYVTEHREELETQQRALLFVDECHLHWDDVCGYGWGKRNERLVLPVGNTKARQTFYGAFDALSGEMHICTYPKAEQDATTDFFDELRIRYPDTKLTICWDNGGCHRGPILQAYLDQANRGLASEEWWITCINFAPHDPEQNPIEEVWRQGKATLQHHQLHATHFAQVVEHFETLLDHQIFDFPKRQMYGDLQLR